MDSLKEATGGGSFVANNNNGINNIPAQSSTASRVAPLLEIVASLPLPLGVSVTAVHGSARSKFIFYQYQGFGEMGSVYRVSLFRGRTEKNTKTSLELTLDLICKSSIPGVNTSLYETRVEKIPVKKSSVAFTMPSFNKDSGEQASSAEDAAATATTSDAANKDKSGSIGASASTARLPLTIFGLKANLPSFEQPQGNGNNSSNSSNSSSNNNSNNNGSGSGDVDKPSPCIILMHGGFGVSLLPSLNLSLLAFVRDFGGIVCLAHVRGGGECGRSWHAAGTGSRRQGAVDDLISAVDFLTQAG